MNSKILGLIAALIIIISSVLIIVVLTNDSGDTDLSQNQDYSPEDVLSEVDESLLDEDGEVEIGEMI